jgi:predicted RecB family nuclease
MSEQSEQFYKKIAFAACAGLPKDWFFPPSRMLEENKNHLRRAREVCTQCPIISECYEHAIRHEEFGFWAGLSPRQRRVIRREQKISFVSFTTQALIWHVDWNQAKGRAGRAKHIAKQRADKK